MMAKDYKKLLNEAYRRMYKAATPEADFDKLVEQAPLDRQGLKIIEYWHYTISEQKFMEIVEALKKEYKLSAKEFEQLKNTLHLGVSPKFTS